MLNQSASIGSHAAHCSANVSINFENLSKEKKIAQIGEIIAFCLFVTTTTTTNLFQRTRFNQLARHTLFEQIK
jgi:hypothetical protein